MGLISSIQSINWGKVQGAAENVASTIQQARGVTVPPRPTVQYVQTGPTADGGSSNTLLIVAAVGLVLLLVVMRK